MNNVLGNAEFMPMDDFDQALDQRQVYQERYPPVIMPTLAPATSSMIAQPQHANNFFTPVTLDALPHAQGTTVWSASMAPDPSSFNGSNDYQPMTRMGDSFLLRAGSQLESRSPFVGPPHAQVPAYVASRGICSREPSGISIEAIARNNLSSQYSFGEPSQSPFGGCSQFAYGWHGV